MDVTTELESLGLVIPEGKAAPYFFGDNVEGYYDGCIRETGVGSGYWLDGRPVFRDVACCLGDELHTHEQSPQAILLPHAVRHVRPESSDELSILHRRRAISIHLEAQQAGALGALFLFDEGVGRLTMDPVPDGCTLSFSHAPHHAAIAATAPVQPDAHEVNFALPGLTLVSSAPASHLTLYLAFAGTPGEALDRARHLRDTDARSAHAADIAALLFLSRLRTPDPAYTAAVAWAKLSSCFLVTEEFGKGIWAGLPWFKNNWGRDTFIALPGTLLVSGLFQEAREVILNFLRFQDSDPASPTCGRVPNRVASPTDIIYNTADGTPWLIRELFEYLQYTGDVELAKDTYPQVKLAIDSVVERATDADGFLMHDDADTWMDARINGGLPWSARGNRANDIQALWHNALLCGEKLAGLAGDHDAARRWRTLADRLRSRFVDCFWDAARGTLADHLKADGRRDEKVRPNQLMVLSIPMIEPLLAPDTASHVVRQAVQHLLFPHGIASLSPHDPYFHPYHHNDDWHHFDAAYHNGTVWGWNAGFTVTALCQQRQTELAVRLAANLADQILHMGHRGTMSELVEAIPRHSGQIELSGTWAQAWSTSEFARNAYQDFAGFHPRLLDQTLLLSPHLPDDWNTLDARFPFGQGAALEMRYRRAGDQSEFKLQLDGHSQPLHLHLTWEFQGVAHKVATQIMPDLELTIRFSGDQATSTGSIQHEHRPVPPTDPLDFTPPVLETPPPCLQHKHYLQRIIEGAAAPPSDVGAHQR